MEAIEAAVAQWFVVLNAMLNGNPAPFAELYAHTDDVTYMGAEGSYHIGWEPIWLDWQAQAAKSTGGKVSAAKLQITVSGDMATATHITQGEIKQPDGQIANIAVRETSVLRKADGRWRMIGHHADGLPYWEEAFK